MAKNGRFSAFKKAHVHKNDEANEVLQKLRDFLDANEPGLVHLLVTTWRTQGKAITYKEIREAILAGDITTQYLEDWIQDYNRFVIRYMQPAWENAMAEAAAEIAATHPGWRFAPYADGVRMWTEQRAASFVTNVTQTQVEGLRAVIRQAAAANQMGVDDLARAVRPMVGLTKPQAVANMNYYQRLIDNGTPVKKAQDLSMRYAARQHRYRGYNIARTELANAYNQGAYEGTKQAQKAGYMGPSYKIWCTADDERVCPVCGDLDGKKIPLDDDFDFRTNLDTVANPTIRKMPPAHPSCRCAAIIREDRPRKKSPYKITRTVIEDDE